MMFGQLITSNSHIIFKLLEKALIRLRVCSGWSEVLLVAHTCTTLLETSCRESYHILWKAKKILISYFFIIYPTEYEISTAYKIKKSGGILAWRLSGVVFVLLINVKMPTILGISTFVSRINNNNYYYYHYYYYHYYFLLENVQRLYLSC